MLANYLKQLRKSKITPVHQALSQLGQGWSEAKNWAVEKQFVFADYHEASNFLNRYTDHCQKLNFIPEWSNVYNKVSVRLVNKEFGITTKEIDAGSFLEMVSRTSLDVDVEDVLSFKQMMAIADINKDTLVNNQNAPTSLF